MNKQIDRALANAITKREEKLRRDAKAEALQQQVTAINAKLDQLIQAFALHTNANTEGINALTKQVATVGSAVANIHNKLIAADEVEG